MYTCTCMCVEAHVYSCVCMHDVVYGCTIGPVLNAWFNDCVLRFFAYIANSMIARVDAAAYGVVLLDLLLCVRILEKLAIRI